MSQTPENRIRLNGGIVHCRIRSYREERHDPQCQRLSDCTKKARLKLIQANHMDKFAKISENALELPKNLRITAINNEP